MVLQSVLLCNKTQGHEAAIGFRSQILWVRNSDSTPWEWVQKLGNTGLGFTLNQILQGQCVISDMQCHLFINHWFSLGIKSEEERKGVLDNEGFHKNGT